MSDPNDLIETVVLTPGDDNVVQMPIRTRNFRIIRTARTEEAINRAAQEGLFPLVKALAPSPAIRSKFAIFQNVDTGEIHVVGDYRSGPEDFDNGNHKMVVPFTFYYPKQFESPFAAYLIPKDIAVGERVLLEDVIEDHVASRWNQGDTQRLDSCEAIWNGKEFDLQVPEDDGQATIIG